MERRSSERANTNLPVKYFCDNVLFSGTIKNLSRNGMFIATGNFLPCTDELELIVPLIETLSSFTAKIRRIEKIDHHNYNIGVELLDPPASYLEFADDLISVCKP